MKKDKLKKVLSIALSAAMIIGTVSFLPQSTWEAYADTATVKNVNLGTRGFSAPTSTGSDATSWAGSKVYYGNKLWRVLDPSHDSNDTEGSAFLFSEEFQGKNAYNSDQASVTWETCTLRNDLNGTDNIGGIGTFLGDTFTAEEQSAINTTTVQNPNNSTQDKLFLLSLEEVQKANYGFGSDRARTGSPRWWLRSPSDYVNNAAVVYGDGYVSSNGVNVDDEYGAVRPAFNLNLSSVLFSSESTASKSSFASVGEDKVNTNTWKLTLKDSSKTVNVTSGESVTQSGQTVTVPYTYTGNDVSQVSMMITDKVYTEDDASILYYGALDTTLATTGTGTFTLPSSLPDGYKIYMMAEDVNDENLTDYSSTPVEIIPVSATENDNPTPTPAKPAASTSRLNLHVKAEATKVTLSWNKVKGADGYYIYGNKCGSNSVKKIKTIKKPDALTWTQKNLKKGKTYKYKVQAYKKTAKGTKILKTSVMVHEALSGSKLTNAKKVTANFTTATLKKGKTKQIKAKIIKQNPKKKLVSHVDKFRYRTNNSKVATVSKSGKIKAVGKGKCNIYVYANNGVYKKFTITVK